MTPLSSRTPSLTCLTNYETATPSVTTITPSDPTATPSDPTTTPLDPTATPSITAIAPPNSPISTHLQESPTATPTDHPCITTPSINPTVATPIDKLPTTEPDDLYITTPTFNDSSNATPPITSNIQAHDVHDLCTLDSNNDTLKEEESFTTSQDNTLVEQPDEDNNTDTTSPNKEVLFHIDDNKQPDNEGSSLSNPGISPGNSGHSIERSLSVSTDNHILPSPKSLDSTSKPISTRSLSYPAAISNGGWNDGPRPLLPCCDRHPLCYNW